MSVVRLELGAEIDLLTKGELDQSLSSVVKQVMEDVRGVKYRRLPVLAGTAAAGTLDIGGDTGAGVTWNGNPVGPEQGWVWEIKYLAVAGLTSGTTPDTVDLYIIGAGSALPWDFFTGNAWRNNYGRGDLVLLPGERLRLAGAITATGTVSLYGSVVQVPAEMHGKIVA